ncbi:CAP domain-containing protein [Candidatus Gottesmanbacteria bacterium]|nr:CAP domain-containing protein [Candidatus Gottesmanbacteria bacterium]
MFRFFQHHFIPHSSNNHKARALHPQAFLFYILLIFVVQVSLKTIRTTFPHILGFATDISVQNLLDLTNQKRSESGLGNLSLSPTLSAAAANKASDMFSKNYWAHIAPDGKTPWDFITGAGYRYIYAGENLAKNFNDSGGVVSAWMDSPTHKDNLLKKEYQEVGFAVVNGTLNGEETTLVVQFFGSSNSSTAPQEQVNILPTQQPQPTVIAQVLPTSIPLPIASNISPTTIAPTQVIISIIPRKEGGTNIRIASAQNIPLFNITTVSKITSLALIGFLLVVLGVDGIFIWRRRTIRVSGHNFAHMLFLVALIGIVYITGTGAIL